MRIICLFGFIRKNEDISYNFNLKDKYELYICSPKEQFEPKESQLLNLDSKIYTDKNIPTKCNKYLLYDYNENKYIDLLKNNNLPLRNTLNHQHPHRVLSMFYNIKTVLNMIPDINIHSKNDDFVILSRIDIIIQNVNIDKIKQLLQDNDIIVEAYNCGEYGYLDRIFIFKIEHTKIISDIYDQSISYMKYFHTEEWKTKVGRFYICPELFFKYHFEMNNLKVYNMNYNNFVVPYNIPYSHSAAIKDKL